MELLKLRPFLLVTAFVFLCTACASKQLKGEPPFVSIAGLSFSGDTIGVKLEIQNINDVAMNIDAVDFTLRSANGDLTRVTQALNVEIDPNTTEGVPFQNVPAGAAGTMLTELEAGQRASLPFTLEGRVHTPQDGYLAFRHEGHLYPVPGKPGQFRSASARSREKS
jgi:hypothetical protein